MPRGSRITSDLVHSNVESVCPPPLRVSRTSSLLYLNHRRVHQNLRSPWFASFVSWARSSTERIMMPRVTTVNSRSSQVYYCCFVHRNLSLHLTQISSQYILYVLIELIFAIWARQHNTTNRKIRPSSFIMLSYLMASQKPHYREPVS